MRNRGPAELSPNWPANRRTAGAAKLPQDPPPRDPSPPSPAAGGVPEIDFEQVFGTEYLHFYRVYSGPLRTAEDVELLTALLQPKPGSDLLDLGCGDGRIAVPLAEDGHQLTGIDISAQMLQAASRKAEAAGVRIRWQQGDLRKLDETEAYDGAFSWFTAFGYHGEAEDRDLLRRIHQALRPGGRLVIDHANRDGILAHFEETRLYEQGEDIMVDRNRFDVVEGRMHTRRSAFRSGERQDMEFHIRLFTPPELSSWLRDAGFRGAAFVGEDLEPFDTHHMRMLVVAEA